MGGFLSSESVADGIKWNKEDGVKVHVQYCGGWGYKAHYDRLAVALNEKFPNQLNVTYAADKGTTGNFDVTVDGTLVHSKKAGKGYAKTQEEKDAIFAAIQKVISDKK